LSRAIFLLIGTLVYPYKRIRPRLGEKSEGVRRSHPLKIESKLMLSKAHKDGGIASAEADGIPFRAYRNVVRQISAPKVVRVRERIFKQLSQAFKAS
jgi:hypothetical protein